MVVPNNNPVQTAMVSLITSLCTYRKFWVYLTNNSIIKTLCIDLSNSLPGIHYGCNTLYGDSILCTTGRYMALASSNTDYEYCTCIWFLPLLFRAVRAYRTHIQSTLFLFRLISRSLHPGKASLKEALILFIKHISQLRIIHLFPINSFLTTKQTNPLRHSCPSFIKLHVAPVFSCTCSPISGSIRITIDKVDYHRRSSKLETPFWHLTASHVNHPIRFWKSYTNKWPSILANNLSLLACLIISSNYTAMGRSSLTHGYQPAQYPMANPMFKLSLSRQWRAHHYHSDKT